MPPILLALPILITLFTLLLHIIQKHNYHRSRSKALTCHPAPPGPSSIFFGIPTFLSMTRAVKEKRFLEYQASRFDVHAAKTFTQTVFGKEMIATIEPENVKAMLATQFQDFCLGERYHQFWPFLGDGIFTLDGEGWRRARGLLRPQFSREQVADLALMDDHVTRLINLIPTSNTKNKFDIQHLFYLLTLDSATHFLFGESVECLIPPSASHQSVLEKCAVRTPQGFAEAFNYSQEVLTNRSRATSLYWLINPRKFKESNRMVHEVVDYYVDLAIQQYNKQNQNQNQDPEKGQKGKEKEKERYIFLQALVADTQNRKTLRDNLLNILLAGRDTTASLLSSAFYYLARNPNVWERLRREIVSVFGDAHHPKADITHARLKDISYLRYVLNETLRLLPPVPINFRVSTKDTSLPVGGGNNQKSPVYVKKNTIVTYSVYAMHRRKDIWGDDADVFRPERWEENAKRGWEFLPFNGGPRICLGQQYALTEASYTIVKIMQRFDTLENADEVLGDKDDPVVVANLTLAHDRGVWVRLYSR